METSGPAMARDAVGPLRRLIRGPGRVLAPGRGLIFRYGAPLGILALIGPGFANNEYLHDNRELSTILAALMSGGAVLPVAIAVRRPLAALGNRRSARSRPVHRPYGPLVDHPAFGMATISRVRPDRGGQTGVADDTARPVALNRA